MKRKFSIATAILAISSLSGCGSSGLLDRERPDEFAVTRAPPLTVPAEFNLPAPQPDAVVTQDSKQQVLDALFSGNTPR